MGNLADGHNSISVSFYNGLLGDDLGTTPEDFRANVAPSPSSEQEHLGMPGSSAYGSVDRLIPHDPRVSSQPAETEHVSSLAKRLADMFEQKQALTSELKSERMRAEKLAVERDEFHRALEAKEDELSQALAQVEQTRVAREKANQFMEEARAATMEVIGKSTQAVSDARHARDDAQKAYNEEHDLRRSLEQLVQESQAQCDEMERAMVDIRAEVSTATRERDDIKTKLAETERDLLTVRNQEEAHLSRIDHLSERNELLARNLQMVTAERDDIRKQFDVTAHNHAQLSAEYESLNRRCKAAEQERDSMRETAELVETTSRQEIGMLDDELAKARAVLAIVRPIIVKAGTGDLRKADIRLLDERMSDYERVVGELAPDREMLEQDAARLSHLKESAEATETEATPSSWEVPSYESYEGSASTYDEIPYESPATTWDAGTASDTVSDIEVDADATADFEDYDDDPHEGDYAYEVYHPAGEGFDSSLSVVDQTPDAVPEGATSFTGMFSNATDDFNDLDEPAEFRPAPSVVEGNIDDEEHLDDLDLDALGIDLDNFDDDGREVGFDDDIEELFDIGEAIETETSSDDIKRVETTTDIATGEELGIDLSDFNALMANFAHYDEEFSSSSTSK